METVTKRDDFLGALYPVAFGGFLLILGSLIRVPFFPVSFTLQTLAISFIALTQTPKQAFLSTIAYLACATMGVPVFGGISNSFWIIGKSAGYLVAFPIAAYVSSYLYQRTSAILSLTVGHLIIYALGFLWLTCFIDPWTAFIHGVLFFVLSDICKIVLAIALARIWNKGTIS